VSSSTCEYHGHGNATGVAVDFGRWFAARVGRVKELTFGTFAQVTARHDMQSSAVSAIIALLHASLECITVPGERASHGTLPVSTLTDGVSASLPLGTPSRLPRDGEGSVSAGSSLRQAEVHFKRVRPSYFAPSGRCTQRRRLSRASAGSNAGGAVPLSPDAPPRYPQISDTSMYSLIGTARGLRSLQLTGFDFPLATNGHCPLSALAGLRHLRHLVLNATRFQDDARRSLADALMAVLADLPQLVALEVSFPRCALWQAFSWFENAVAEGCCAQRSAARRGSLSCEQRHASRVVCPRCVGVG